jgi:hypothetical protein
MSSVATILSELACFPPSFHDGSGASSLVQPDQRPPSDTQREVRLGAGLYVCGDHRDTATVRTEWSSHESDCDGLPCRVVEKRKSRLHAKLTGPCLLCDGHMQPAKATSQLWQPERRTTLTKNREQLESKTCLVTELVVESAG